jgi:hypothetical protein
MARSNGPLTPSGAGRTPRPDPQNWAQGTPQRQAAPRGPQQPQFAPQSAGAAYQQAAYGGQPAGTDPRYARPQTEQRAAAPQRDQRAPAASNAFDSFVAQQAPSAAPAYETTAGRQAGYAQAAAPAGYAAGGYGGDYPSRTGAPADQNGFGQWSNSTAAPAADARGFDYGGYGTAAPAGQPAAGGYPAAASTFGGQNGYGQAANYDQDYPQEEWNQGEGYEQEPSLDPAYGQQGYGHDQQGAIEQSYEDDDYDDEPRSRRKLPLIAAAVVGALVCGGGLAYGYKTFLGPVASVNTPLIKTSSIPSKVKPDDPGGRKFAHSENTIMGGSSSNKVMGEPLTDGPGASAESAKKVQTVEVRPDGSVVSSDSGRPSHASAGGMDFPTAGDVGTPDRGTAGSSNSASSSGPSGAPQVIAKAEPTPPPSQASATEVVADEAPPAAAAPKKVQSKKVAAVQAPEASMGPAPTGAGWVAVLASVPVSSSSQMDSLKQFADMQQKYGDVLGDKTPSVQEANLGEKGRYHRLVVGPPASRDSASSICGSLKTAGYAGCWVMQY